MAEGLTDKQRAFVEHYLECWNATEAARRAGYSGSDATLASVGFENLRKPEIAERVSERLRSVAMGADETLMRLALIARSDMTDFVTTEGGPVSLDLRKASRAGKLGLIKSFKRDRHGGVTVELHDPVRALELIGRHHGLFREQDGQMQVNVTADELAAMTDDQLDELHDKLSRPRRR